MHHRILLLLLLLPLLSLAQETPSTVVTTNADLVDPADGLISLREALAYAGTGILGTHITFNLPATSGTTIHLTDKFNLTGITRSISGLNLGPGGGTVRLVAASGNCIFLLTGHANLTLDHLTLSHGNRPIQSGGAILNNRSTLTATHCLFDTNSSGFNGGAISCVGNGATASVLLLRDCHFLDNEATSSSTTQYGGAAIYCRQTNAHISSCSFEGNHGVWGGAIKTTNTTLVIDSCTFSGNSSDHRGGAIEALTSSLTLFNTLFDSNSVHMGSPSLADPLSGGAIYSSATRLQIANCAFSHNTTPGSGGALFFDDNADSLSLIVTRSTFGYNSSTSSDGGALGLVYGHDSSWALVTACSFLHNQARHGGAVYTAYNVATDAPTLIASSTFAYNQATWSGGGGALSMGTQAQLCNNLFLSNLSAAAPNDLYASLSVYSHHNVWDTPVSASVSSTADILLSSLPPQFPLNALGQPLTFQAEVCTVQHTLFPAHIGSYLSDSGVSVAVDSVGRDVSYWDGVHWVSVATAQPVTSAVPDSLDQIGHPRGPLGIPKSIGSVQRTAYQFDTATLCPDDIYLWQGLPLTLSGDYSDTTLHGLFDTISQMHLVVFPSSGIVSSQTSCEGYQWHDSDYAVSGTYTFPYLDSNGCPSTDTLHLVINYGNHNAYQVTAIDSFNWHSTRYTTSGIFDYSYLNTVGCPSTDTLYLTIIHSSHNAEHITACESYTWHGVDYTASDVYLYSYLNDQNAPSSDTLYLTINHGSHNAYFDTACENFQWHGTEYLVSGEYTYDYINTDDCPSTDTLHLVVHQGSHLSFSDTACETYQWHGTEYLISGEHIFDYFNTENCPSIDTLHLVINHGSHYAYSITAVDSYTWHGSTYFVSGLYTYSYIDESGCPSADTLHLTINYSSHNTESITACDYYVWHGLRYTTSGQYTYSYLNEQGVPNTDTLYLTINHGSHNSYADTACETYLWHGTDYLISGDYTYNYINTENCPSTDTLHLVINYGTHNSYADTTCDSYQWHGTEYLISGEYTFDYINTENCPSTDTLHLVINYGSHNSYADTACETYLWHGTDYLISGDYTYNYINTENCPSTDSLHLVINHGTHNSYADTACDSYQWCGTEYLISGVYTFNYINVENCPSTDTLHLTIIHSSHNVENVTACESYTWHDSVYTVTGQYSYSYVNEQGAESEDSLYLTVVYGSHVVSVDTVCDSFMWQGTVYMASGEFTYAYVNSDGCASEDTLRLTVAHSESVKTDTAVCDSFYWTGTGLTYFWEDSETTVLTDTAVLTTVAGCDSTVVLQITLHASSQRNLQDSVCVGSALWFHGTECVHEGIYRFDTVGSEGCDSTVGLELTVVTPPEVSISQEVLCDEEKYRLSAETEAPYVRWFGDGDVVGESTLVVEPRDSLLYTVRADWRDTLFCPSYDSVLLLPLTVPRAVLSVSPQALDEGHLTLTAISEGRGQVWRRWSVNGVEQTERGSKMVYEAQVGMDSVCVELLVGDEVCQDSARVCVQVRHPHLYVPNVFLPGDGEPRRQLFCVTKTRDVLWGKVAVFDRAGRKVFAAESLDECWNGTCDGQPCPQGSYVYSIKYATSVMPQGVLTLTGTVTLLR